MSELTVDAKIENLDQVLAFVNEEIEKISSDRRETLKIDIAVEEIFVNIVHYAYTAQLGKVTIEIYAQKESKEITLFFKDSGTPYDPLKKPDPDTTLSAEERPIGGLGIYMVKKSMNDVFYEYRDGQNILRLRKTL